MNIGGKIKELRRRRGVTQEQMADSIGISFQAISKWENGVALPDIALAPVLASYFGVSMDELFDFHLKDMEDEVERIAKEARQFIESDPAKGREILQAGLAKYPENDVLLVNLLYVLNASENPDETIRVVSRLIEMTDKNEIRYDALRFLAYAYKAKGDIESAKAAIKQIPEITFTKLTELAYLLEGDEKQEAAEKQKQISCENLLQMMWKLAEYYESVGEIAEAICETEKALSLVALMENASYDVYDKFFREQIKRLALKK